MAQASAAKAASNGGSQELLKRQLEFYFSDANLRKDRFLQQAITDDEDRYIDIAVFLKFNKVSKITSDVEDIRAALESIQWLELSPDGCRVRRKTPVDFKKDVDACTVYVEGLPRSFEHTDVQRIFSRYGKVVYISLPRYPNKVIKGFAFIEYEKAGEAKKCRKGFGKGDKAEGVMPATAQCWSGVVPEQAVLPPGAKGARPAEEDQQPVQEPSPEDRAIMKKFRVLSKTEWLKYKREYRALQRRQRTALKRELRQQKETEADPDAQPADGATEATPTTHAQSVPLPTDFEAGLIVKLSNIAPGLTKGMLRSQLAVVEPPAYLEYSTSAPVAYVRMSTPKAATMLVEAFDGAEAVVDQDAEGAAAPEPMKAQHLQGDEEKQYWERISQQKQARHQKKRGPSGQQRLHKKQIQQASKQSNTVFQGTAGVSQGGGPDPFLARSTQEHQHLKFIDSDNEEDHEGDKKNTAGSAQQVEPTAKPSKKKKKKRRSSGPSPDKKRRKGKPSSDDTAADDPGVAEEQQDTSATPSKPIKRKPSASNEGPNADSGAKRKRRKRSQSHSNASS